MIVENKIPQNHGYAINPIQRQIRKRDNSFEYESLGFAIELDLDNRGPEPEQVFTREQALRLAHSIIKAVA